MLNNEKEITKKALTILQAIYSMGNINKKVLPLNDEYKTDSPFEYFHMPDIYPIVYEDTICKIIELSILLRREKEFLDDCKENINTKVKFSNIGKYVNTNEDVSFSKSLSKIVHAKSIELQSKDKKDNIGYGYTIDRNCEFTGVLRIGVIEIDKSYSTIDINIEKFCINAMMLFAKVSC